MHYEMHDGMKNDRPDEMKDRTEIYNGIEHRCD